MNHPIRWLLALVLGLVPALVACGDDDTVETDPGQVTEEEDMSEDDMSEDDMSEDDMSEDDMSEDDMSEDDMSDDDMSDDEG